MILILKLDLLYLLGEDEDSDKLNNLTWTDASVGVLLHLQSKVHFSHFITLSCVFTTTYRWQSRCPSIVFYCIYKLQVLTPLTSPLYVSFFIFMKLFLWIVYSLSAL